MHKHSLGKLENGGLLTRRQLLALGASAPTLLVATQVVGSTSENGVPDSWQRSAEGGFSNYGQPREDDGRAIRWIASNPAAPGEGVSWTPLHDMAGTITSVGLHFERHHNGVPLIDAADWSLNVHGLVNTPLAFTLPELKRFPLRSKIGVIECGGNSNSLWLPNPAQLAVGHMHGLVSCSEWTGVLVKDVLARVNPGPDARWLLVHGLDASGVSLSLPLSALPDDTLIAMYQNGEALHAEHGFPARLFIPGWEGIYQVKWLHRLELSDKPLLNRFDSVSYSDLNADGSIDRFTFAVGVKSVITSPSPGMYLAETGIYDISGIAWSGAGKITRVEVSANGKSWVDAELEEPIRDKAFTRFRIPWQWDGSPALLLSRAHDESGQQQPARKDLLQSAGQNHYYHYNAVNCWAVSKEGNISHVYHE